MPPDDTSNQPAKHGPQDFDFILNPPPKPKRRFGLPGVPKAAVLILFGLIVVIVVIIVSSIFFGGSSIDREKLYKTIASAEEIVRVSDLALIDSQDANVKNLAATAKETLNSQSSALQQYMQKQKIKIDRKKISIINTKTDSQLQEAAANNVYDQTFLKILKDSINSYQAELSEMYKVAGPNLKTVLSEGYASNASLLGAPQLK